MNHERIDGGGRRSFWTIGLFFSFFFLPNISIIRRIMNNLAARARGDFLPAVYSSPFLPISTIGKKKKIKQ